MKINARGRLLLLLMAGCGGGLPGADDASAPTDAPPSKDLVSFAGNDLGSVDLSATPPPDLAAGDLPSPMDFSALDLRSPDLAPIPDLSHAPDLLAAPDLAGPGCPMPLGKECQMDFNCLPIGNHNRAVCLCGYCKEQCYDELKDGDESDVDCGGSCADGIHGGVGGCAIGQTCNGDGDCLIGICQPMGMPIAQACIAGRCTDHCHDGILDDNETDVDCGELTPGCDPTWECGPCGAGKSCAQASDCKSGKCVPNGKGQLTCQ